MSQTDKIAYFILDSCNPDLVCEFEAGSRPQQKRSFKSADCGHTWTQGLFGNE